MAYFSEIIQEINEQINTNGQRAITGAKLNEVLRDMISSVDENKMDVVEIDTVPTEGSTNPVQSGGVEEALGSLYRALSVAENCLFGGLVTRLESPSQGDDHRYYYITQQGGYFSHFDVTIPNDTHMATMIYWSDILSRWVTIGLWPTMTYVDAKANKVSDATQGNLAGLDFEGNLTDSGIAADDVASTSDLAGKQDTISDLDAIRSGAALGATALQTETDPTVPSWAKQSTKPSYDYSEIGDTPDLSGFITNTVNNLTNYYLKSETYTQAEVNALIGAIQQFHYEIYATLPQTGQGNVLYLIGPTGSGSDKYEEYVYSNSAFTKIGDTSIDLSGYVTTSALNTALADYTTTANLTTLLSNKADKCVPATTGNIAKLTAQGNLADGGLLVSDIVTFNNIAAKADMVSNATSGHFAGLDSYGNLTDSGSKASDFATAAQGALADTAYQKPSTGIPASDLASGVVPTVPVQDVTVGGTSVVTNGVAVVPSIPDVSGKADKVTGAVSGNFAGLDNNGNLTDSGHKHSDYLTSHQDISGKSDKVVYVDASTPPSTMDANKVYQYGTLSGNTTFPAFTAVSAGDTEVKIWCWTFTTPSTAPTITWPAGITAWNGGSAPTINASKNYEVNVMNGVACILETDIPTP